MRNERGEGDRERERKTRAPNSIISRHDSKLEMPTTISSADQYVRFWMTPSVTSRESELSCQNVRKMHNLTLRNWVKSEKKQKKTKKNQASCFLTF